MNSKISILVFSIVLLTAGCNRGGKQGTMDKEVGTVETIVEVKVQTVYLQSVEQEQIYTGTILPNTRNMISSFQATMRIDKIMVEVGDYVTEGQLLVRMEETNYLQAKMQVENLKVDFGRVEALYQSGGVSKQQLDQMKVQLEVAQESLANLQKNTFLKSPVSGTVTMRNFDNGDLTGGQPILQVQQLNPLKILINIQEVYYPLVKPLMAASIRLESYPDDLFEAKVKLVYPTIDPVTHTFTTEMVVNNTNMKIRPGMFARVSFVFGSKERIVVPDRAVVKQSGVNDRYVYVLNSDQTVSYTKVVLGQRMGSTYELLSGLQDGDIVVTAGLTRLVDGTKVKVVE
ncbi:MAG: efflux RND transporter periplasmic adaptor subunit [Prevotellaceae bacterium]|jgi:RND family efflux transporter MFP subunit|nr:efflux RND transporter periplasmic adaptor subunit [Prevotellaceae bacterium]